MSPKVTAYTTRKMKTDYLKRIRILASVMSADGDKRVTMEQVIDTALERGLPLLEEDVFNQKGAKQA